jgi:V/A-type H+-transporting ATPase subunit K
MCAAAGADTVAETGQGFGNCLMVVGIAETISLFAVVFTIMFA